MTGNFKINVAINPSGTTMNHITIVSQIKPNLLSPKQLKRYLKKISDKTLSQHLKELESDELIIRTVYPQIPPKVEYSLSEKGHSLMRVLDQLCIWGLEHRNK